MKVKTWIIFKESYIPPRCRKPRYIEREEFVDINLPEAAMSDLHLAFEDKSYDGEGRIYFYKGRLWALARMRHICCGGEEKHGYHTPLEALVWWREHGSAYFSSRFHRNTESKKDITRGWLIKKARADMRHYLLVDGELYRQVSEPRYCIYTFGLGHNHGGTALSVDYQYNPNISKQRYFSALQGAEAVAEAKKIALGRGDTESIHRFKADIEVFMPELVKVNPRKQHGDGNPLLNFFDDITAAAPDTLSSGLLCISAVADLK